MGKVNADGSVQNVCPYRFTLVNEDNNNNNNNNSTLQFVYCGDRDILDDDDGTVHDDIERVVIVLHGYSRDADDYYEHAVKVKRMAHRDNNNSDSVVVLAPQFLREKDLAWHGLSDEYIFWRTIKWNQGIRSVSNSTYGRTRPFRMSSFQVMNQILQALNNQDRFPSLETIVIFGHGAGSQYVQRYAAGCTVVEDMKPTVSFVLANPGTQFYLSPKRVVPGTKNKFAVPTNTDNYYCPEYDDYKYGLQNMNAYMSAIGQDTLKANYVNRNVNMMLGELDNNNWPDLDLTCQARLQGRFRRERGVIFQNHLVDEFGQDAVKHHGFYFVPGSGHNQDRMMQSTCGIHLTFGVGTLQQSCSTTMSKSPLRYWTCQGCKRNIAAVLLSVSVVCGIAAYYYRRSLSSSRRKKTPLLQANGGEVI